jgi:hypothetical protein
MYLTKYDNWFTSVMLENKGNQYLTYVFIWGNGKSIKNVFDEIR